MKDTLRHLAETHEITGRDNLKQWKSNIGKMRKKGVRLLSRDTYERIVSSNVLDPFSLAKALLRAVYAEVSEQRQPQPPTAQ